LLIKKLCRAIKQKQVIKFYYESRTNQNKDWRIVEPYMVGIRKGNGNIFLTGWFIPSADQILQNQKLGQKQYLIDQIKKFTMLSRHFNTIKISSTKIYNTPTINVICKIDIN